MSKLFQLTEWHEPLIPGYERVWGFNPARLWLEGDVWFIETRGSGGVRMKERVPDHAVRDVFRMLGRVTDATE